MQHSNLGASGMHRWMNCPGSVRLSDSLPARRPSIYAVTGTVAHKLIEEALTHGPVGSGLYLNSMEGTSVVIDGHSVDVDADLLDGVRMMVNYVWQVGPQYDHMDTELRVRVDTFLETHGVVPPVPMFATTDVFLASEAGTLEIVDYKNGTGIVVAVRDNPQLMYYAAGALLHVDRELPNIEIRHVKITIVQPHAGDVPIRSQVLDVVDVIMWVDDVLVPAVRAVTDPNPAFNPGTWCRFCPGARACPALIAAANELAKREFGGHQLPDEPSILSKQLDLAEKAVMWANALQAYALELLEKQVRIPGWGLEPTRATRKWADEDAVIAKLAKANFPLEVTHKLELRSPAQLEKTVRTLVPRTWWDQSMAPLIEAKSSGVKLARTKNPSDPVTDFSDGDA